MPKAPITNDFAFGSGTEDEYELFENQDSDFDSDLSSGTPTLIRPNVSSNYTTYVKADTPNQERRRLIVRATLFAVIVVPSVVFAFPGVESYVLLGIMAFTFATNFAITLMSANLEDKATSLELKTDTLLDELNSAASTLRNFQKSLETIDLDSLKENVANARTDLEPLMERLSNPSLERIVANVEQLLDYAEDMDFVKIDRLFQTYKKDAPTITITESEDWDWENDAELLPSVEVINPQDDDFFPEQDYSDEFLP